MYVTYYAVYLLHEAQLLFHANCKPIILKVNSSICVEGMYLEVLSSVFRISQIARHLVISNPFSTAQRKKFQEREDC